MSHDDVLVIGGTGDIRAIRQRLDITGVCYALSATTPTGERLAGDTHGRIHCGCIEQQQVAEWPRVQRTRWVIDASRLYAEVVNQNIVRACASVGVLLSRYQGPEQPSDLRHPLFHVAGDLNEACTLARRPEERTLLTTGSRDLAAWWAGLAEKTLLVRVLSVPKAVQHRGDLEFDVGGIFAPCGLLNAEFNAAFYHRCRTDVMVTRAPGAERGYQEKVQPCLDAGVPCIVIARPAPLVKGDELPENQASFAIRLTCWLSAA